MTSANVEPLPATPVESDGIISCSVEETNRIRAQLGLKPLRPGPSETRDVSETPEEKPSTSEIRRRIDETRARRIRDQMVHGPGLGDLLEGDADIADPVAWVDKMRKEKSRAGTHPDRDLPEDRDSDEDASDLKVVHKAHELELRPGQEMILTLKDRRLIDEEGELDDTDDLLENYELAAKSKRDKSRIRPNQKVLYNPFDDDIEEETIGVTGSSRLRQSREVLSHYDEWAIEAKMVKRPKGLDAVGAIRLGDITANSNAKEDIPNTINLTSVAGIQKDFLTLEEVDALKASSAVKFKKGRKGKKVPKAKAHTEEKGDFSVNGVLEKLNPDVKRPPPAQEAELGPEDLDDAALYAQLAKRRRLVPDVLIKSEVKQEETINPIVQAVALVKSLEGTKAEEVKLEQISGTSLITGTQSVGIIDIKPEGVPSSALYAVEYTPTTEFCRTLETPLERLQNAKEELQRTTRRGLAAVASSSSCTNWRSGNNDLTDTQDMEQLRDTEESDDENLTEQEEQAVKLLVSEDLLDGSVASALRLLKGRGELDDDVWQNGRRNIDNKPLHVSTNPNDVKIEYKDEFGRVLSPKDAFRYISWAFHGKGPGKKKREKLLKKIELEKKKKRISANANNLPTMQALKKVQKSGQAYVVLSSSNSTQP